MDSRKIDLSKFFNPRHIAIVGVPRNYDRFGGGSFLSKFRECGFPGKLYPINPQAEEIQGLKAYPNLSSLPEKPDLAIVAVAAKLIPSILEECARIGLSHIHILSSGFKELGTEEGKALERKIASIAREAGLAVIGPNCMGPYCPSSRVTAWGAIPGMSGPVGIIAQSGGVTQRMTEYLCSLGIGTEKAVSIGNATVLDTPDYLEFMAHDDKIRAIGMYLESVKDSRRFFLLAKEVSKKKPIVLWKGGESEAGARTAASHTGALAGHQQIWDAFYRQTGVVHVYSLDDWVDALMALCLLPAPCGKGVFIIGGGGGNSVVYGDACAREGLHVPALSQTTMSKLRETVPVVGSIAGNPLDMWRIMEDPDYLLHVLDVGYNDSQTSMIIVDRVIPRIAFHMPDIPEKTAEIIEFVKKNLHRKPTVFTVDSGGGDAELAAKGAALRAGFSSGGVPAFPSIGRTAKALFRLHRYHEHINH